MPIAWPAGAQPCGDEHAELFSEHADRLRSVVSRTVFTSAANVEDACGFAWLQLVRHRPPVPVAFAWLCRTAVREAVKLHRRTARSAGLDQMAEVATDPLLGPDGRRELILAGGRSERRAHVVARRACSASESEATAATGRRADRRLLPDRRSPADPRAAQAEPDASLRRARALGAIDRYAGGSRALAWIDDAHDERCVEWACRRPGPTVLVTTDLAVVGRRARRVLLQWAARTEAATEAERLQLADTAYTGGSWAVTSNHVAPASPEPNTSPVVEPK